MDIYTKEFKTFCCDEVKKLVEKHGTGLATVHSYEFSLRSANNIMVYAVLRNFSIRDHQHGPLLKEAETNKIKAHYGDTEVYNLTFSLNRGYIGEDITVMVKFH